MLPKVVFDTNILISAIIFGGNPRTCLELVREGKIKLYISKPILYELAKKLHEKFEWDSKSIEKLIVRLSNIAEVVDVKSYINLIKNDPTDNKILELASEVKADFIVSGDKKHILSIGVFGKTQIVSSTKFLETYDLLKNLT